MTKEKVQKYIDLLLGVIMVVMVLGALWQVFGRYILRVPNTVTDELLRYLLIWSGMLGTIAGFFTGSHMALTLVNERLQDKPKILYTIKLVIDILLIVLFFFIFLPGGITLVSNGMQQISPILQVPMGIIYIVIPFMAFSVGVIKVVHLIIDIKKLKEAF